MKIARYSPVNCLLHAFGGSNEQGLDLWRDEITRGVRGEPEWPSVGSAEIDGPAVRGRDVGSYLRCPEMQR